MRSHSALTIADGIAVKRPGELTLRLIKRWVDQIMVVVPEDEVAEAMVFLLERAKLVVEGAGAVGVAALLAGRYRLRRPRDDRRRPALRRQRRRRAAGAVARRHESQAGRRLVLLARLPDRPGSLALLLTLVGDCGANVLDVEHIREGFDLHVRETAVQLVLETRGPEHARQRTDGPSRGGLRKPMAIR